MSLITCPECEKQVSEKAYTCPKCGYPLRSQNQSDEKESLFLKKKILIILILVFAGVLCAAFVLFSQLSGNGSTDNVGTEEVPQIEQTVEKNDESISGDNQAIEDDRSEEPVNDPFLEEVVNGFERYYYDNPGLEIESYFEGKDSKDSDFTLAQHTARNADGDLIYVYTYITAKEGYLLEKFGGAEECFKKYSGATTCLGIVVSGRNVTYDVFGGDEWEYYDDVKGYTRSFKIYQLLPRRWMDEEKFTYFEYRKYDDLD